MSSIKLSGFIIYLKAESAFDYPDVIMGANKVFKRDGANVFQLASVPVGGLRTPPEGSLYLLYGNRDLIEELHKWRIEARSVGAEFRHVEMIVKVGSIHPGIVSREDLIDLNFVNVRRMSASLQLEILQKFYEYVCEEGGSHSSMSCVRHIASRADLWPRLMDEDRDFQNISVMVIPVADQPNGRLRYVAVVRRNAVIASFSFDDDHDLVCLEPGFGMELVQPEIEEEENEEAEETFHFPLRPSLNS